MFTILFLFHSLAVIAEVVGGLLADICINIILAILNKIVGKK